MTNFTEEQRETLKKGLRVGKCPNCGYEGCKNLSPQLFNLVSAETDAETTGRMDLLPVVTVSCPRCGLLSFFAWKQIKTGGE